MPPDEPRRPPTSRLARTARLGGLVAGQSARWAGTRAANLVRSPERADAATGERTTALAAELVEQLGQLRGAAMKVGQVLSTVDFTALPEEEREKFKQTLAALRDDVPPLPFREVEKLLRDELGERPAAVFAEFDEEAFAAASIGQVHRAVTREGVAVAVKIQYPGVAEAVDTDLRNLTLVLPLLKRLAPGLDVKALYGELRERIGEELDYEIEAQSHRAVARAHRDHPFVLVPEVLTRLSSRRVLVTELVEGARFEEVKRRDDATRDRFGEIVFRFYFGLVKYLRRASGDPHPGNYLLLPDGRVGFLDFGLMRVLDEGYLEGEQAVAAAVEAGDAVRVHAALSALGYLPDPGTFDPEGLLAQISAMGAWYLEPGERRFTPAYVADLLDSTGGPRSPWFDQMRRQTIPPQALLLRRMEGLVFATLGEVRASADWNAIAREFYLEAPPATPLGEEEAVFWSPRSAAA
jgi:predicted unusual protein kinase regulating ubiquinone biosynthesis (AarF/ABC1/UbiB family)